MFLPEAAVGGLIAFIEEGDIIAIDIPANTINVKVSDEVLAERSKMAAKENLRLQQVISQDMLLWLLQETRGAVLEIK